MRLTVNVHCLCCYYKQITDLISKSLRLRKRKIWKYIPITLRTIFGHRKDKQSIHRKNCNDRKIRWPMNTEQMGKYLLETRSFQGPIHKLKDTAMYVKKKYKCKFGNRLPQWWSSHYYYYYYYYYYLILLF
jgi:hypothetical protein